MKYVVDAEIGRVPPPSASCKRTWLVSRNIYVKRPQVAHMTRRSPEYAQRYSFHWNTEKAHHLVSRCLESSGTVTDFLYKEGFRVTLTREYYYGSIILEYYNVSPGLHSKKKLFKLWISRDGHITYQKQKDFPRGNIDLFLEDIVKGVNTYPL